MRFTFHRSEDAGVWFVLDNKFERIVCSCRGWYGPDNAAAICEVLNLHEDKLYNLFGGKKTLGIKIGNE